MNILTARSSIYRLLTVSTLAGAVCAYLMLFGNGDGPSYAQRSVNRQARPTKFSHVVEAHKKECSSCHTFPSPNWERVRSGPDAFPDITDYPKHDACVSCHRQEFFTGRPPQICSICHTQALPEGGLRYPFPNPRELFDKSPKAVGHESAFAVYFPHDKHIGIVSDNGLPGYQGAFVNAAYRADEASCAVCHATIQPQGDSLDEQIGAPPKGWGSRHWLKKGTFKSAPTGHQQCFTCHSADSGMTPAPTDCATCHKPRPEMPKADFDLAFAIENTALDRSSLLIWKNRISSGKFRHGFAMHADLECATCHTAEAINTLDPMSSRVSIASCTMCHATATAADGGGLNIEFEKRAKNKRFECVLCHITFGRQPAPASHTKALAEAGN